MVTNSKLYLRVNGIDIARAKVRRKLADGSPLGEPEVVIDVPAVVSGLPPVGEISLDGNEGLEPGLPRFVVEVRERALPVWKTVNFKDLANILTSGLISGEGGGT